MEGYRGRGPARTLGGDRAIERNRRASIRRSRTRPASARRSLRSSLSFARRARRPGARDRWDLDSADSAFAIAMRWDAHFPQAALWLALTRRWNDKDSATWHYAVVAADAGRSGLGEVDRDRVDALKAIVAGRQVEACT